MGSQPKRNKSVAPPKKVADITVVVNPAKPETVTSLCHKILKFVKTIDRQGVEININVDGKRFEVIEDAAASMLD